MLRSRGTLRWITGKKGVYFEVINAIYRYRWKGSILVSYKQSPGSNTGNRKARWGTGVREERNESSLSRMGSLFILLIYLQMKGGSWFKPTTIFSDFWAEGRQRTGEEGV